MLAKLNAERNANMSAMTALVEVSEAESRDLTEDERTTFATHQANIVSIDARIANVSTLPDTDRVVVASAQDDVSRIIATNARVSPNDRTQVITAPQLNERGGFVSFGDFARTVAATTISARNGSAPPRRALDWNAQVADWNRAINVAAPTNTITEGSGDLGMLVPPQYATEIMQHVLDAENYLGMCNDVPVTGNGMTFPRDESTPWGASGVRAYWENEAAQANASRPTGIEPSTMRLHKLMAMAVVTSELLDDAPALGGYLFPQITRAIDWKIGEAIFTGSGVGQPLGIHGHASELSVAFNDLAAFGGGTVINPGTLGVMLSRLLPSSQSRARWFMNTSLIPHLLTMTVGTYPVFIPGNNVAGGMSMGTVLGLPAIFSAHAPAAGAAGVIRLYDLSMYRAITKAGGGVKFETSMHLYFDYDLTAFRVTFRIDGQPAFLNPVTFPDSVTRSPFVRMHYA
jgi:HK97 family phage major capsid protein